MQKATFGAGCFWGIEAAFRQIPGVAATAVGYMGGITVAPTYDDVCTGQTGHAEVVQVQYDPHLVAYEELLAVFWSNHNPTTHNRQGFDIGTQYRSVLFVHTPEQEAAARGSVHELAQSGRYRRPVVTDIALASTFYRAEEYHQRYFEKHGMVHCAPAGKPSGSLLDTLRALTAWAGK